MIRAMRRRVPAGFVAQTAEHAWLVVRIHPEPRFLTGLTTGESRTVKKNWKSVQILGRTLGRGGFAGG